MRPIIPILLLVSLVVCPTSAQVLLSEQFNDPLATGWVPYLSGWYVSDGVYHATNTTPDAPVESVWSGGGAWTDYAVEADVRILGGYTPADAQLMFRYQGNQYVQHIDGSCNCTLFQYGGTFVGLYVPGLGTQLTPFPYAIGEWHRLRATASAAAVSCEVVGHPETRMTAVTTLTHGTIGLRGTHVPADFDNVVVTSLSVPVIHSVSASPSVLWPPNHKMVSVNVDVAVENGAASIVDVTSSQPSNATGDGNTSPDWEITGPLTVSLRAERAGSEDRIYTIHVRAASASGAEAFASTTVRVGK